MYDLDFREFLEARGPVGGAFGKTGRQNRYGAMGSYNDRIAAGKDIESQITSRMTDELGFKIMPTTSHADKNKGIDGWIVENGKSYIPIQMKTRANASGNDILWETVKPWEDRIVSTFEQLGDRAFTGKDMKSQAKLVVSISNDGRIVRLRSVTETIDKAKEMAEAFVQNYRATGRNFTTTQWGQIRLVKDPSRQSNYWQSGEVYKLNAFLNPDAFNWKKDFTLRQPIGAV